MEFALHSVWQLRCALGNLSFLSFKKSIDNEYSKILSFKSLKSAKVLRDHVKDLLTDHNDKCDVQNLMLQH